MFVIPKYLCNFVTSNDIIMPETTQKLKIVYVTPALYMAGGVERVLTLKANYFAKHFGYDITIILTEGKRKPFFYPLSPKINVINLDIHFEELWTCSFLKKIWVYLKKQRLFKKALTAELMRIRPDITVSLLRREINFIHDIKDGSRKIGELHVNRANYRNFEANNTNILKNLFARFWMRSLVQKLQRLDHFIVLTEEDAKAWPELDNISVIPDPLSFVPTVQSPLTSKRVLAVGRYVYQKGFDLLLQAWAKIEHSCPEWSLAIYGDGDKAPYESFMHQLGIDATRCHLNGPTSDIQREYVNSSLLAFSSRFEGFGMVLVEAMACGLPVVSFDCPCGPKDIVCDGEDGLLAETGNVDDLARKLLQLITDDNQRTAFARHAQQNAQRFSMDRITLRWKAVFISCVNW